MVSIFKSKKNYKYIFLKRDDTSSLAFLFWELELGLDLNLLSTETTITCSKHWFEKKKNNEMANQVKSTRYTILYAKKYLWWF